MKLITRRKLRLKIKVKLYKKRKMVFKSTYRKKSSFMLSLMNNSWDKAYFCVYYDKGFSNAGIYNSRKDCLEALSAFTEISLIDYVLGNSGGNYE